VKSKTLFSRTLNTAGWRKRQAQAGVEFGVYGKVTIADLQMMGQDKAQRMRQKMVVEKIFRANGRDYAQGMKAAAVACGVGAFVIERLGFQGRLRDATTYADGIALYDIEKVLKVLRDEGQFLDMRDRHIKTCTEAELKYMRGKFNSAMKYHELPFRKYKVTNVPRIDGTIRVDDTMTIEEARAKAAAGDFTGADDFNKAEQKEGSMDWLTEGAEEELSNQENTDYGKEEE